MNVALWIAQGFTALAMAGAGALKLFSSKEKIVANPALGWAKDSSAAQIKLIGLAELLGAIGLVVPWASGILPILTPIAAACLAVIMVGAIVVHLRRKESPLAAVVLLALLIFVAAGRYGAFQLS